MKKALITGITGQDGAYLSKFLIEKGYEVLGTTRDSGGSGFANLEYLGVKDDVQVFPVNLCAPDAVTKLFGEVQPDEIYHLAAQSSVGLSFKQPAETIRFNTVSTLNLLEALKEITPRAKFYQSSSSEMFGKVVDLPATEETVLCPTSPYAISKAAGHWLAVHYREAYGLFCCCGILFNHESVLRGKQFVTKKIVATAVRISQGAQEKLTLGNTSVKRDWGYAPEYIKAIWLMLQKDKPDDYVIATNAAHSLQDFVEIVFSSLGMNAKDHVVVDQGLFRPSDIDVTYGSPRKVKETLGWRYDIDFQGLVKRLVEEEIKYQEGIALKGHLPLKRDI